MSNQHVLKIHPAPLADLLSGAKTAEVRRNDRGFQVGDTVRLMEVNPETGNWTGAADHVRTISHIQTGYGLPEGMCVLSYAQAEQQEAQGAQAGGELIRKVSVALARSPEITPDEARRVRAALATQPAVPVSAEAMSFEYAHISGERRTVSITREDVIEGMEDALYEKLSDQICRCEPIGETHVVECNCQDYVEEFALVSAKPAVRGAEHE